MAAKISRQNPGNGGDQPSAQEALLLGITLPRGGCDHPILCPLRRRAPTRASRRGVQPQNKTKRGKTTTGTRSPEKQGLKGGRVISSPPKYRENPRSRKNARGPEWHPEKTPERKDARPKRETNPVAAGTKTRKRDKNTRCVWGCAQLLPKLSLLKENKQKQKRRRRRRKNQGREKKTQKHQT